ncbi:MAG: tetraacyldisaccharide 4'-kinase [Deltaproteobacteria bacterium]|nr:tetraacyldisaccharide 4'-kinase [Deltaproteobacteria bacterium]
MNALQAAWYPAPGERPAPPAPAWVALERLFGLAVSARGALFDSGLLRQHRVEGLRVLSVGNLSVGGTGKTPAVGWLAAALAAQGQRVAVLSRGYGRRGRRPLRVQSSHTAAEVGDEPLLLARALPEVPVYVGADRVGLAAWARAEGATWALLDDGFQHRRLARDVDLLVVDAASPFGNGRLLPAGPLREPVSAARRASAVWLRCARADEPVPAPLAHLPVIRACHAPDAVLDAAGTRHPLAALQGTRVLAFAGLARPGGFFAGLARLGAEVVEGRAFPDHHAFTGEELARLARDAGRAGARCITTAKDAVRLPPGALDPWVLLQRVEILHGAHWVETWAGSGVVPGSAGMAQTPAP